MYWSHGYNVVCCLLNFATFAILQTFIFFLLCGQELKSNLHYTRGITPKRVRNGGAPLLSLTPYQHSFEEISQRWQVVDDLWLIRPGRGSNPTLPAS